MAVAVHTSEPSVWFFLYHKVASRSILNALETSFPDVRLYPQSSFRPPREDHDWPRLLVARDPWARTASCFRNKCRDALEALERNGTHPASTTARCGYRPSSIRRDRSER